MAGISYLWELERKEGRRVRCFNFEKYLNQQELQVFIKPENKGREFLYFQHFAFPSSGRVIKALFGARRTKNSSFTCPVWVEQTLCSDPAHAICVHH